MSEAMPMPNDGCSCTPHVQDAGGGHFEHLLEYEPACPEHSEHLWDPRRGMWVDRAAHDAAVIEKFLRERDTPSVRIENPEAITPLLAKVWAEGYGEGVHDERMAADYNAGSPFAGVSPARINPYERTEATP